VAIPALEVVAADFEFATTKEETRMIEKIRQLRQLVIASSIAATLGAVFVPVVQAADEQFFMLPSYRVGPYGANGQAFYGGFVDYLNYVNMKGGIDGVQNAWEECETEYNNAKGVECY
jgi:branched-chain amino acid transport system substrate-binding protein